MNEIKKEIEKIAKDKEWEIGVLLYNYAHNKDRENRDKDDDIRELYARSIALTVSKIGMVYVLDDFIEDVKHGYYIDFDGSGYALDYEGNEMNVPIYCDVETLNAAKEKGVVFVEWCSK